MTSGMRVGGNDDRPSRVDMDPSGMRPGDSERLRLARLARDTARSVPGVIGVDADPMGLFITAGGDDRVPGVVCVATRDGGHEVVLRLVCDLMSLPESGEQVKTAVARAAAAAGIMLDSVAVHVAAVADTGRP